MSRFHVGFLLWVIIQWEVASESDSHITNYYGHLTAKLAMTFKLEIQFAAIFTPCPKSNNLHEILNAKVASSFVIWK